MTVEARQNPFAHFTDTNGDPLAGGYVYFGLANQDPRQYPAVVYYDKALTLVATQPLRTTAGYLSRNGSPTNVYMNGDCSVLVLDSAQRQVSYDPQWIGVADAAADAAAAAATAGATAQAAIAATQAGLAATAKTAAEAARDAALAAAKIYANTTAGLAGVASGSYFYVPSTVADESLILYLNSAGTAVEQKRYASAMADLKRRNELDVSVLPPGPRGLWFMDRFTTTGRNFVPNSVASAIYGKYNLLSAARHRFNDTTFFSKLNAPTVVDDAVAGPNGLTDAATVTWGAVDAALYWPVANLPAGTYTLVVEWMSNTGADQNIQMGALPTGGLTTKVCSAASYTRVSQTFTRGSTGTETLNFVRALAAAAGSVRLHEVCLYAGTADLGPESLVGHLVFSQDAYNNQPTYASGAITLGSAIGGPTQQFGITQFENFNPVYEFTVLAVGKRKGAPAGANYYQVAVASLDSFNRMTAAFADGAGEGPVLAFGNTSVTIGAGEVIGTHKAGLWNYKDNDLCCIGSRYDGTKGTLWRGDIRAVEGASSGLSSSIRDMVIGAVIGGQTANYDIYAVAYWERALTDAEVRAGYQALKARVLNKSSATIIEPRFLCAEGDSITFGFGTGVTASYAHTFGANSNPQVDGVVPAVSSSTLLQAYEIVAGASLERRASYIDAMIPSSKRGRKFILSLLVGNDFVNGYTDATAYAAAVSAYCAARKAAGWDKIVLITILPRTVANFNTRRNAFNTIVRAGGWAAANSVDAICDFAADATYGPDAAASDVTKYPDGIHPSQTAQTALEAIYRATVNAL